MIELRASNPYKVAILFIVFNRLDYTKQVLQAISKAKPTRLYVAADGPRMNYTRDTIKVEEVRNYIIKNIDWECEVKTLFRDNNLGCKYAVSEAITWFFEHESMGIILEDDCLPSNSFFAFCEHLLNKYMNEEQIMHINGSSFMDLTNNTYSYYFSKYCHMWGWATWKKSWEKYTLNPDCFQRDFMLMEDLFNTSREKKYWYNIFDKTFKGRVDTWDFQWNYSVWRNRGLAVYPFTNLIKNIGFGLDATHTIVRHKAFNMTLNDIDYLVHPPRIIINRDLDLEHFNRYYQDRYIIMKALNNTLKNLISCCARLRLIIKNINDE